MTFVALSLKHSWWNRTIDLNLRHNPDGNIFRVRENNTNKDLEQRSIISAPHFFTTCFLVVVVILNFIDKEIIFLKQIHFFLNIENFV